MNSMKSISAIYPAIMENAENSLVNCVPHALIHESLDFSPFQLVNNI